MMRVMLDALWDRLVEASQTLIWVSALFGGASLVLRRRGVNRLRRQWPEIRLNLVFWLMDTVFILPLAVLVIDGTASLIRWAPLPQVSPSFYNGWPVWAAILVATAVSDFVGYWRHRWMHSVLLWPAHAIHHSDRTMTWTTLMRFHPVNRFINVALNSAVLTLLGFPPVVLAGAGLIRHVYGFFCHADLPWRFGPLAPILVSPIMHRWHHCRDEALSNKNFATIFALWDWVFGTLEIPVRDDPALGLAKGNPPRTWAGQMVHPFQIWARRLRRQWGRISPAARPSSF